MYINYIHRTCAFLSKFDLKVMAEQLNVVEPSQLMLVSSKTAPDFRKWLPKYPESGGVSHAY
jgi:hypothetical protein